MDNDNKKYNTKINTLNTYLCFQEYNYFKIEEHK